MTRLVVVGAGWLGHPLCQQASDLGWKVEGTRRSPDHTISFERYLAMSNEKVVHTLSLHDAWWVCALPPRARQTDSNYLSILQQILALSKTMSARGFLLCSSTGVYSDAQGIYDERSALDKSTERQRVLVSAEQLVTKQDGKVLRLAGLVGPGREPGNFVAGKTLKSSSHSLVNMIHQQDVIDAIFTVLSQWKMAQPIYNVCHGWHPTRISYYQQKCEALNTVTPEFSCHEKVERIIDGSAICQLGFKYNYDI
jgi:nucleoside-diphosphate-sugar epimerase